MKPSASILLITLALTTWAAADLPKKAPFTKYTHLVQNSPFTSRPVVTPPGPVASILDDYALAGVSPINGGYRVTLINKKNPEERIPVSTDEIKPKHGFKILEVKRKEGNPLGTTVRLSSGSVTGTVAFEDKFLTLATPPAAKTQPNPQHPVAAPSHPGAPNQPGQMPSRQPRPRVVPPSNNGAGAQANPFQPGGQQRSQGGGNRFDRRGGGGGRR